MEDLKPIENEKQYRDYLSIIDKLIDCPEESNEEILLEKISEYVEEYEDRRYPIN